VVSYALKPGGLSAPGVGPMSSDLANKRDVPFAVEASIDHGVSLVFMPKGIRPLNEVAGWRSKPCMKSAWTAFSRSDHSRPLRSLAACCPLVRSRIGGAGKFMSVVSVSVVINISDNEGECNSRLCVIGGSKMRFTSLPSFMIRDSRPAFIL
jgi:hypothetical protein